MAFFKSLKNFFNNVYVNGVLTIYKTIKLISYQFYWEAVVLTTVPASKNELNACIGMGNGSTSRNSRIYYVDDAKLYMFTGYTWIYVGMMPEHFGYTTNNRRGMLCSLANLRLYYISCSKDDQAANNVYYLNSSNTWVNVGNSAVTPYNMYNAACVEYGSYIHVFGGGTTENHLKHYVFDQSSWSRLSDLPKDLSKDYGNSHINGTTAIVHNDVIHYIGYCSDENMIYDCVFNNGPNNTPTLISIRAGSGYDNYIMGAFEDANHVLYAYTQRCMYRFNDSTNTWTEMDSNNIGQYTKDSIVLIYTANQPAGIIYRMQNSKMYILSVAYKLEFED